MLVLGLLLRRNIAWASTKGFGVILSSLLNGRNPFTADILSNAQHNDTGKPTTDPATRFLDEQKQTVHLLVGDF